MSLELFSESPRVRTVMLVLAEASRMRAEKLGGQVVSVEDTQGVPKCLRCEQPLRAGQRVVRTWWVQVMGGSRRVPTYECGPCSLEKVLSARDASPGEGS